MFLGEYQHSLDAKGRIILPAKFRARLAEGLVLTKGQDSCLYVYPRDEWDRVAEGLSQVRLSSGAARGVTRIFFSGASEQDPDRQGRVSVPEPLREYAGLDRDVTVIGAGPRVEIWSRASWERYRGDAEREFSAIAEANPDLPL